MFVIEVIPLKRGVQIESLSYFATDAYGIGTILTIPVRNQQVRGIVVAVKEVSAAKTALRAATFSLRKLPRQEQTTTLSPALMQTAQELAEYYASSQGAVLHGLLPPPLRDGLIPIPFAQHFEVKEQHAPFVIQGTHEERFLAYRSLVRETFAHAGSIVFVVPSSVEAETAQERLGSGIEDRIIVLTSTLSTKALGKSYSELEDFSKPKLIIATPSHALLERYDITHVIVEAAHSQNYKERARPYFDYRMVLRVHASHTGRQLIFGDLLLRTEEEVLRQSGVYESPEETPKRISLPGKLEVVLMKDKPEQDTPFRLFSPKVLKALEDTGKAKGRSFLFAARRGLAPVVACNDCGHIFRSPESGAPYSLIRLMRNGTEQRYFLCPVSGARTRAADVCPACGSWRLKERGIGIQNVYDELGKELNTPIILFDHTTANTYKKASFLRKKFYETKGAVLLGTQMALPYLTEPIQMSAVINMDALRATPTWHQEEETLSILLALRERTSGSVFIQTRTEPDALLEYARTGALEQFYSEEIELRKTFNYPPFSHFIHLTWQGNTAVVEKLEHTIKETLGTVAMQIYSGPPSRDSVIKYGLIRVPRESWPQKPLVDALRLLPPSVRIVMNPDRII